MKYFYYLFLPVLFYPIYFLVVNITDTLVGDQQLINWLYFGYRSVLLQTFANDWLSSLPVMYAVFYILILPAALLSKRLFTATLVTLSTYTILLVIVTAGSYMLGFRESGLIVNATSAFFMISLHLFSQAYLLPLLKK